MVSFLMLTSFVSQGFNENWVKEINSTSTGSLAVSRMVTDMEGNIIMVGNFSGKIDFNPSSLAGDTTFLNSQSLNTSDAYVAKYGPSGTLIWAKSVGLATNNDGFNSVVVGKNNQLVICGYIGGYLSKTDVNTSTNIADTAFVIPNTPRVGIVVKYDKNGNYLFHHQNYASTPNNNATFIGNMRDVALDSAGVIYVVSDFVGTFKFSRNSPDVSVGSLGNLVVATYDSTSLQWTRVVFNSQTFYGERIIVKTKNKVNSIYVTGRGAGNYNLDFDNGPGVASRNINTGFFVAKYFGTKTDMTYGWVTAFNQSLAIGSGVNTKWNSLYDIKLGTNDTVFVAGAYQYGMTAGTLSIYAIEGGAISDRSNGFVGAMNPTNGAMYWLQNMGSIDFNNAGTHESVRAIHLNGNGTMTILGNYEGFTGSKSDIDPTSGTFFVEGAAENTFMARLKTNTGTFLDAAVMKVNTGTFNAASHFTPSVAGRFYLAGTHKGNVLFPDGTPATLQGNTDGYLAEIISCPTITAPSFSLNNVILESGSNYRLCTGKTLKGIISTIPNGYTGDWLKTINNATAISTSTVIADTISLASNEIPGTTQTYNSDIKLKVRLRDGGCYTAYSPEFQVKRADLTARPTTNIGSQSLCGATTLGGDAKGFNITGYKWYKNGVLAGTNSTYLVDGNTGEIDTIRVSVTGACGVDSSATPFYYAKGPVLRFKKFRDTTTCNVDYKAAVELIKLTPTLTSFLSWSKLVGTTFTAQTTFNNNLSPSLPITAGATESWRTSVTYTDCPNNALGKFRTLTVSDTLKLTRKAIITATTQPTVTTEVCEGTALVSLSYVVSSPTTATYSWKRGSTVLPKDSATLRLKNLSVADSGNYVATATGYCNTLVSNVARVKVNEKSVITRQPVGDTVCINFGGPAVNIQTSAKITGFRKILQWQRLQAPSTWRDIPFASVGYKDTLNINATISTDPQGGFNGSYILPAQYRLRVQDQCLSANFISSTFYSDTIVLMSYSNPHTNAITLTGNLLKATAAFTNSSYPTSYSYKWFKDDVLIDGENSGSYTASSSGDYKVEVANYNYCKVISPVQKVTITSINDQGYNNQDLLLNYKDGVLQLINEEYNKGFNYELLDVQGRSIAKGASKIEIIKALNTGTYLLHIHNSNKSDVVKFVISE